MHPFRELLAAYRRSRYASRQRIHPLNGLDLLMHPGVDPGAERYREYLERTHRLPPAEPDHEVGEGVRVLP